MMSATRAKPQNGPMRCYWLLRGCLRSIQCHAEWSDSVVKHLGVAAQSLDSSFRFATLGMTNVTFKTSSTLSVKTTSSGLFRLVKRHVRNENIMKVEALKKRLDKNRPMTSITIRIPEDVIEDLKRVAPLLGFSGYQPLVRAYLGQGLRADLERLEGDTVSALVASLKRHGVNDEVIQTALSEVAHH